MKDKKMKMEMEYEKEGPEMKDDYQVECDANDLMRSAMLKQDKARYAAALSHLQKKKAAIESLEDLKAARNKSFLAEQEPAGDDVDDEDA